MNQHPNQAPDNTTSTLAQLRALVPERALDFHQALRVAELQATTLRRLTDAVDGAIGEDSITDLPRLRVVYRQLPTSGMSYWDGRMWVIAINSSEPPTRQRFTLLHEFKHIMDHSRVNRLYGAPGAGADKRAEQACDFFAGCVLMPKRLVKRAWGNGMQRPAALAEHFEASERAVEVRLAQLGLTDPPDRCAASRRTRLGSPPRRSYYRALSLGRQHVALGQAA